MLGKRPIWVDKRGGFSQGKIKDRAHLGLSHCLHIVFSGPPQNWRAHLIGAMRHGSRENGMPTLIFPSYSVVFEYWCFWHEFALFYHPHLSLQNGNCIPELLG